MIHVTIGKTKDSEGTNAIIRKEDVEKFKNIEALEGNEFNEKVKLTTIFLDAVKIIIVAKNAVKTAEKIKKQLKGK